MTAKRKQAAESGGLGFWDRPVLMNLAADILLVLAVTGLTGAASVALQRLPFYPLRQILVDSRIAQVTPAQLEQATRVALTGNFFTIDLDGARAAYEKLPWVRNAEVRRRWPDALELRIEEHRAVARWRQADGESRLVNDFGEVFAAASEVELPVLSGPEGAAPLMLARFREFEQALAVLGRRPERVLLSSRQAWQVRLDDGVLLELGRDEAKHTLDERLARFVSHYRSALDRARMGGVRVADMRYPNGFALKPARTDAKS
jgi:cell division protein FtsQ